MCREYSQLIYTYIKDPTLISNQNKYIKVKDCVDVITLIVNGTKAEPKEFPHMVIVNKSILVVLLIIYLYRLCWVTVKIQKAIDGPVEDR